MKLNMSNSNSSTSYKERTFCLNCKTCAHPECDFFAPVTADTAGVVGRRHSGWRGRVPQPSSRLGHVVTNPARKMYAHHVLDVPDPAEVSGDYEED